jgi:hypothetical protein
MKTPPAIIESISDYRSILKLYLRLAKAVIALDAYDEAEVLSMRCRLCVLPNDLYGPTKSGILHSHNGLIHRMPSAHFKKCAVPIASCIQELDPLSFPVSDNLNGYRRIKDT